MTVELVPIMDTDVATVADFLHANLNTRVSSSTWSRVLSMPWKADAPNYGFMLRDGQRVLGVYVALYSERLMAGRVERFCNLASWSVLPEYRFHSIRLLKALLAQDSYHFTDLAPNEKVEAVNARLKFRYLDTSVALLPTCRGPPCRGRTKISADADVIAGTLAGPDLELYRDHAQAPAAHHLVVIRGTESCYVMFRKRWRRERPVFAAILYVSNPSLFQRTGTALARYLLVHYGLLATFAELRIVGPGHTLHLYCLTRKRCGGGITHASQSRTRRGIGAPSVPRCTTAPAWSLARSTTFTANLHASPVSNRLYARRSSCNGPVGNGQFLQP